jgi:hypothetical protein
MRTWAIFAYGVAVGLLVAYVAGQLLYALSGEWLLIGAAIALGIGLILHQRQVSLSKGRRWKKTT